MRDESSGCALAVALGVATWLVVGVAGALLWRLWRWAL